MIFLMMKMVCDYIAEGVVSSFNSPDVRIQDKVKASSEGEVEEEPGGECFRKKSQS